MRSVALLLLVAFTTVLAQTPVQRAICVFSSLTATPIVGSVSFSYDGINTTVNVNIQSGLPASSSLGFHVHAGGFLGTTDGGGALGHFDPFTSSHGAPNVNPHHAGDMGNLTTTPSGSVTSTFTHDLMRLDGVASIIGRIVIIHKSFDDGNTQPTGNSGARIAQCVVGKQLVDTNSFLNNATADQTGNTIAVAVLMPTPSTFANTRQFIGRAIFDQQTSLTMSLRICGFAPNSTHAVAITQFGDLTEANGLTSVGNNTNVIATVSADANGVIDVVAMAITGVQISTPASVLGQALVVYETSDATNNTNRALIGIIGTFNSYPVLPACPVEFGSCLLVPTAAYPTVGGKVTFKHYINDRDGVFITGAVTGLPPNTVHAWHVHEFGDIRTTNALGTGSHFNPQNNPHGLPPSVTRHIGDMGNMTADGNGVVILDGFYPSYLAFGLNSATSIIGRALVVHAQGDDGSQPVGNAGARMAQCVIGITNAANSQSSAQMGSLITNVAKSDNNGVAVGTWTGTCELANLTATPIYGRVLLQELPTGGVRVQAKICGVAPLSDHGFHVHQFGDLTGATLGANIASHWNPQNVSHGYAADAVKHVGDMGNITADANGNINVDITIPTLLTTTGVNSIIGRAVVVHANADNGGQPTGNSGTPIATCVIGFVPIVNSTLDTVVCANQPTPTPTPTPTTTSGPTTTATSGPTTTSSPGTTSGPSSTTAPTPKPASASTASISAFLLVCVAILAAL